MRVVHIVNSTDNLCPTWVIQHGFQQVDTTARQVLTKGDCDKQPLGVHRH